MPKSNVKPGIHLDLLRPQSNPEKIAVKLVKWLLSSGRLIFIVVEALVLIAFFARFKLDADIQSKKEIIDQQIPYIQSLKPYEILIKQIQLKLSTIAASKQSSADYPKLLKEVADQMPAGIKITSLTLNKQAGGVTIQINGQAQSNNDVTVFINGLKEAKNLSNVNLVSIGIEAGILRFSASATSKIGLEKNL